MAWIFQTKQGSRKSGGPQYYLQDLTEHTKETLRRRKQCPVRLWTPYGVLESGLQAVSSAVGAVKHDRVQTGGRRGVDNIADQIASWYRLNRADIDRIDFDDSFDSDDIFVMLPSYVTFHGKKARTTLYPDSHPLTLVGTHQSPLITRHVQEVLKKQAADWRQWVKDQIDTLVEEHERAHTQVDERDLLRASGALHRIGIRLGTYRREGIDCPNACFKFDDYPEYGCPIEVEECSSGFLAQHHAKHRKQRVVLLCMTHDAQQLLRGYVDILELRQLGRLLGEVA